MKRLIQDLLDVTSIESGHLSLRPERHYAAEIVSESLDMQTPLAKSASLDLRVTVAPNLPDIWADHDRLLQVFENLIGNAIKFTRAGGQITLGAEASTGEVVFSVSDTGSGIAESDLPHVFDRFWQASHGARRGAGLGLAIVRGIVEAHGGRIRVRSSAGQGTTFSFTIPTVAQKPRPRARVAGSDEFTPAAE
jgi:signal transduction histidine kinase